MSWFTRLFGKKTQHVDSEQISCVGLAKKIRERISDYENSEAMVVIIQEACRIQVYYFIGISFCSWGYNHHQFSTDRIGEFYLVLPHSNFTLIPNTESILRGVLQSEFMECEVTVGSLWKLDIYAPDYERMKLLHANDFGIRISFRN